MVIIIKIIIIIIIIIAPIIIVITMFLKKLLVSYVIRLVLEYSFSVWNPVGVDLEQDIERVHRPFIKRLHGLSSMPYEDRLVKLQPDSLKNRRKRIELITDYKALLSAIDIDPRTIGVELTITVT